MVPLPPESLMTKAEDRTLISIYAAKCCSSNFMINVQEGGSPRAKRPQSLGCLRITWQELNKMHIPRPVGRQSRFCRGEMRLKNPHVQETPQVILMMEAQVLHSPGLIAAHSHHSVRGTSVQSPETAMPGPWARGMEKISRITEREQTQEQC